MGTAQPQGRANASALGAYWPLRLSVYPDPGAMRRCGKRRRGGRALSGPPASRPSLFDGRRLIGVEIEQAALLARPVLASPGSVLLPEQLPRLPACPRADTNQAGADQREGAGFRNNAVSSTRLRREHRVATRTASIEMKHGVETQRTARYDAGRAVEPRVAKLESVRGADRETRIDYGRPNFEIEAAWAAVNLEGPKRDRELAGDARASDEHTGREVGSDASDAGKIERQLIAAHDLETVHLVGYGQRPGPASEEQRTDARQRRASTTRDITVERARGDHRFGRCCFLSIPQPPKTTLIPYTTPLECL